MSGGVPAQIMLNLYSVQEALNILAQRGINSDLPFTPIGTHTSRSDLNSAQIITIPDEATKMLVQALTQNVRYTFIIGVTPTPTVGFRLVAGDSPYIIPIAPNTVIKFIEETPTAVLQYQFGK